MAVRAVSPVQVEQQDPRLLVPGDNAGNYNKIVSAYQRFEKKEAGVESLKFYTDKRSFETMGAALAKTATTHRTKQKQALGAQLLWMLTAGAVMSVIAFTVLLPMAPGLTAALLNLLNALGGLGVMLCGAYKLEQHFLKKSPAEDLEDQALQQMAQRRASQLTIISADTAAYMLERYNQGNADQRRQVAEDAKAIWSCTVPRADMMMIHEAADAVLEKAKLAKKQD
jgi:hypothetical protein